MSMDEMLLQELYGAQQHDAQEQTKQAQIQLVEAVAAEAGVDLNELSDDELAKFAHYVLSDEDEDEYEDDDEKLAYNKADALLGLYAAGPAAGAVSSVMGARKADKMYREAGMDPKSVKGRQGMLRAAAGGAGKGLLGAVGGSIPGFAMDEGSHSHLGDDVALGGAAAGGAIGSIMANRRHKRVAKRRIRESMAEKTSGYEADVETKLAEADLVGRQMARSYIDELSQITNAQGDTSMNDVQIKVASAMSHVAAAWQAEMFGEGNIGALRGQLGAQEKTATLANAGYMGLAKVASYSPEQFAAEAELRAAEILAAYGVHPETLDDIEPANVKLSSFPGVDEAANREEAGMLDEYNQMLDTAALHIIENLLGR